MKLPFIVPATVVAAAIALGACSAAAQPATSTGPVPPVATQPPAAALSPDASVVPSAAPSPDGKGDEHFTGTWTFVGNMDTKVAGHDAIGVFSIEANDPRVTTDGKYDFALRMFVNAGPTWGTVSLWNTSGAWAGPCSGGNWLAGEEYSVALSCWLTGARGYEGQALYLQMLGGTDVPMRVDGIVYPGAAPAPEPTPTPSPAASGSAVP